MAGQTLGEVRLMTVPQNWSQASSEDEGSESGDRQGGMKGFCGRAQGQKKGQSARGSGQRSLGQV